MSTRVGRLLAPLKVWRREGSPPKRSERLCSVCGCDCNCQCECECKFGCECKCKCKWNCKRQCHCTELVLVLVRLFTWPEPVVNCRGPARDERRSRQAWAGLAACACACATSEPLVGLPGSSSLACFWAALSGPVRCVVWTLSSSSVRVNFKLLLEAARTGGLVGEPAS